MAGTVTVGVTTRIIVMSVWNLLILPNFYGVPFSATIGMLPLLALFNAMQGTMTIVSGNTLHEAYVGAREMCEPKINSWFMKSFRENHSI